MEYKHQSILVWQTFVCLLFFIMNINGISTTDIEPEISSTQDEIITYINHTARLSCIIQNRNRQHVTWSRINFLNETQKMTELLYIDLIRYTRSNHYHVTHIVEKDNREYWNLEIRQIRLSDQGYYSCALPDIKPISKIFYIKVIENTRNVSVALRSTSDIQHREIQEIISSLSLIKISVSTIFLMVILLLVL